MDIVVNDASILIDLIDINLIYKFFDLGFIFYTTGYVISELSDYEIIGELVHANRLRVQNPDAEEQLQIGQLNADYNNLSIHDCSCLWLSEKKSAIMLTGDKALTRAGKKIGMEVHGSLWILDELVKKPNCYCQISLRKTCIVETNKS